MKTDKQDAITISNYGIDHWYRLKEYEPEESIYAELKLLGRQYRHYMRMRVESVLELTHLLDYTMPGIKTLLKGWNETNGKDKLGDFVEEYWHYDNITKKSEEQFIEKESAKTDSLNQGKSLSKNGTPVTFLIEKTDYNNGLLFFINSIKGEVIIDDYKTNFPTG